MSGVAALPMPAFFEPAAAAAVVSASADAASPVLQAPAAQLLPVPAPIVAAQIPVSVMASQKSAVGALAAPPSLARLLPRPARYDGPQSALPIQEHVVQLCKFLDGHGVPHTEQNSLRFAMSQPYFGERVWRLWDVYSHTCVSLTEYERWANFVQFLVATYSSPAQVTAARAKLAAMIQGSLSLDAYTDQVLGQYALITDKSVPDVELQRLYIRGMQPALRKAITTMITNGTVFASFPALHAAAQRAEAITTMYHDSDQPHRRAFAHVAAVAVAAASQPVSSSDDDAAVRGALDVPSAAMTQGAASNTFPLVPHRDPLVEAALCKQEFDFRMTGARGYAGKPRHELMPGMRVTPAAYAAWEGKCVLCGEPVAKCGSWRSCRGANRHPRLEAYKTVQAPAGVLANMPGGASAVLSGVNARRLVSGHGPARPVFVPRVQRYAPYHSRPQRNDRHSRVEHAAPVAGLQLAKPEHDKLQHGVHPSWLAALSQAAPSTLHVAPEPPVAAAPPMAGRRFGEVVVFNNDNYVLLHDAKGNREWRRLVAVRQSD
jgi:hypothetical protein